MSLPPLAYWHTLENVLTQYVRHSDNKFDYDNEGIAHRKHIKAERIRYIGKESNNLEEASVFGIDDDSYLEYESIEDFKQWILSLRPKDVRDKGISKRELKRQKAKIRNGKLLNPKVKIVKILIQLHKEVELG